ncbi:hypothetical protein ILUMI_12466, partial [Ignelater luminosus]
MLSSTSPMRKQTLQSTLFLNPTDRKEVLNLINGRKSNKSSGSDGICFTTLKNILEKFKRSENSSFRNQANKKENVIIIQIYALTSTSEEEEKDLFYDLLEQATTEHSDKGKTVIVMGDFNVTGLKVDSSDPSALKEAMNDFVKQHLEVEAKIKTGRKLGLRTCLIEMNNTHEMNRIMQSKSKLKDIHGAKNYINNDVTRKKREKQKKGCSKWHRMEMKQGRGKISKNYNKKLTGKSGNGNTMTEMPKKIEWNTGKQAVNKYEVTRANLTRKTKNIKQSKNIIGMGTWNLRGINEVGKIKQLNEAAEEYGADIVALQEIKQTGNNTVEIEDYVILGSGCEQKIFGMGFM